MLLLATWSQGCQAQTCESSSKYCAYPATGTSCDDLCGCRLPEGWSVSGYPWKCKKGSETELFELKFCTAFHKIHPWLKKPNNNYCVDRCGCKYGETGWSSHRNGCYPGSETQSYEVAHCSKLFSCPTKNTKLKFWGPFKGPFKSTSWRTCAQECEKKGDICGAWSWSWSREMNRCYLYNKRIGTPTMFAKRAQPDTNSVSGLYECKGRYPKYI